MRYRFTLSHTVLGQLEITEPDGWKDAKVKLERHDEFHSLIEYFDGAFVFYGDNGADNGGINFLKQVLNTYGPDADLNINIDLTFDDITFSRVFTGQLDLSLSREIKDNLMQVPIIRNDFWSKFISRIGTPVNLKSTTGLDGDAVTVYDNINLNLVSQKLEQRSFVKQDQYSYYGRIYDVSEVSPDFIEEVPDGDFIYVDLDHVLFDEIKQRTTYATTSTSELPLPIFTVQYGGDYTFDIKLAYTWIDYDVTVPANRYEDTNGNLNLYIKIGNDDPILMTETDQVITVGGQTDRWSEYTYSDTVSLEAGTEIRIYGQNIPGTGAFGYGNNGFAIKINQLILLGDTNNIQWSGGITSLTFNGTTESFINVTANTVSADTQISAFLLHDAVAAICDRIISRENTFYSEYLGSSETIARTYPQDGCQWMNAISKGLQIRGYSLTDKPNSMSFNDWWNGANPMLNLGLGYDIISGQEVIRIENKKYFYQDTTPIVNLSNVREITKSYDPDYHFKKITTGYKKWQSEEVSGIDDPQTKHIYATRFKKIGKDLSIESDFIAASLTIENTRRTTIEQSKDYKYDNDNFIISLNPDPVGAHEFDPEFSENFSSIINLKNSDFRYNIIHSPVRVLLRWSDYFIGCLKKYPESYLQFTLGEGNYDMVSDYNCGDSCRPVLCSSIAENDNIALSSILSIVPQLFTPELFEISTPIDWDDYKLIRDNKRVPIGISQTSSGHQPFYIKSLEYTIMDGTAKILAWPRTEFRLQVIQN